MEINQSQTKSDIFTVSKDKKTESRKKSLNLEKSETASYYIHTQG